MSRATWAATVSAAAAVVALLVALRARQLAADARAISLGHALDRKWHPRPAPPAEA